MSVIPKTKPPALYRTSKKHTRKIPPPRIFVKFFYNKRLGKSVITPVKELFRKKSLYFFAPFSYTKNCTIEQILNSDGTCTSEVISGKSPLGVVVAIKDNCGYAMTTSPIQKDIKWSTEYINTGAFQSSIWSIAITDFDVSGNMTKIIQAGDANTYPAAYAALNYAPSVAPTSKGKWALPTAGILYSLYTNLSAINNAISKLGGTLFTGDDEHTWSSSEATYDTACFFCTNNAFNGGSMARSGKDYDFKSLNLVIRPVLPF